MVDVEMFEVVGMIAWRYMYDCGNSIQIKLGTFLSTTASPTPYSSYKPKILVTTCIPGGSTLEIKTNTGKAPLKNGYNLGKGASSGRSTVLENGVMLTQNVHIHSGAV